jgi:hypothetical protein
MHRVQSKRDQGLRLINPTALARQLGCAALDHSQVGSGGSTSCPDPFQSSIGRLAAGNG